jgi:hypothetical protein
MSPSSFSNGVPQKSTIINDLIIDLQVRTQNVEIQKQLKHPIPKKTKKKKNSRKIADLLKF